MVTRSEIASAHRWLLGRDPVSHELMEEQFLHMSAEELRHQIMATDEFFNEVRSNGKLVPNSTWVCRDLVDRQGFRIWGDLYDKGVGLPALFGEYEPVETRLIRRLLAPGDHFLDIGANIGWFTLNAASCVGPSGRVVSFEPSPIIFPWLARSVVDSGFSPNVDLHRLALSDQSGFLLLDRGDLSQNPGGASARSMAEFRSADAHHLVRSVRGDDRLGTFSPHVVKIDVEGAELNVFLGIRQLLDRARPIILCEIYPDVLAKVSQCTTEQMLDYFEAMSYTVFSINNFVLKFASREVVLAESRLWFNVVFAPREIADYYNDMQF